MQSFLNALKDAVTTRYAFEQGTRAWPRYLSVGFAVWLFVSAFAWPHSLELGTDTWVVAVFMFSLALWTMRIPGIRFMNSVLAGWLFFSTIAMHAFTRTLWNNLLVSIVMFALSFVSPGTPPEHASARAR